jgi:hypothetical protein
MRRAFVLTGLAVHLIALAFLLPAAVTASPADEATFIIPASDGYGVAECLATGGDCAAGVAQAWCTAQGYARATQFGVIDRREATGSLKEEVAVTSRRSAPSVSITCSVAP